MVRVLSLSAMDISTHSLSPGLNFIAFGVCQELVGDEAPASYQYLYLYKETSQVAPKSFSGSTSYLPV